jgi:hypothetical protein
MYELHVRHILTSYTNVKYGRGGAANIINDGQPAGVQRKGEEAKAEEKGLLAKGKDFLNKLGKK